MAVECVETRMDRMRNLFKPFGRERSQPANRDQGGHDSQLPPPPPPPRPHPEVALRDEDDEDVRLALQISAAEQGPFWGGASAPVASVRTAPTRRPLEPTDSDEAIARHLQEQLDLEAAAAGPARGPPPGRLPQPDTAHAAPQLPPTQPSPSAPHWQPQAPSAPWAVSPRATHPPPAGPRDDGRRPAPSLAADPNVCGGCGKPVHWLAVVPTALGRRWHPGCLRCAHCSARIQSSGSSHFALGEDGRIYHVDCHKLRFHPRCDVCSAFLPAQPDGLIRFHHAPFWGLRFCPGHEGDGTPRCLACNRLQPHGEEWVKMDDSRFTCLQCLHTLVRNTPDAQPLYDDVLHFYASMSMPLPMRPPLMLVESGALNEAEDREGGHRHDGPVFHTRGLTLSEEHRSIRTVVGSRQERGGLMSVVPQMVPVVTSSHCEVTAILVLFGLPWLLTGSILAHETMHAWLRLSGISHLPADVEEGLAQLMALLWLEHQAPDPGSYEERLASYLAQQIRADPTPIYGEGFRAAHEAFQLNGLVRVLKCVKERGTLPL